MGRRVSFREKNSGFHSLDVSVCAAATEVGNDTANHTYSKIGKHCNVTDILYRQSGSRHHLLVCLQPWKPRRNHLQ